MKKSISLKIDENIINKAKIYAQNRKMSLSEIVELYLNDITKRPKEIKKIEITPLVKSLSGVVKSSLDFDYKKERFDYISEKYKF